MNRCAECGFDYATAGPDSLPAYGPLYAEALTGSGDPRRRSAEGVWSPLEYACHVRDVLRVQRERVLLALAEDDPVFTPMGRDELVVTSAYNRQDPAAVLAGLTAAAADLAAVFASLQPEDLSRTGTYTWPEEAVRSLDWLGRHSVHEAEHHLLDIRRQSLPGEPS